MNSSKVIQHDPTPISKVRALFGIDSRSLAFFRIAIGGLLLVDLSIRRNDLNTMYSEQGVMPIAEVRQHLAGTWYWSLHFIHGATLFQATLFLIAALLAVALLVGFYTRLVTIGSWILLASLYTRAPFAVNGGDTLLLLLLFWSMFLPLGQSWSVDALRKQNDTNSNPVVLSIGSCAILIQIFLVYFCTLLFKCLYHENLDDLLQGTLIWGDYNRPLGDWLLEHPGLVRILSWITVCLELVGPLLLFIPWRTASFRLFTLAAFIVFHIGTEMTITVGLFSYIAMAAWTLFLPTAFWSASCWNRVRKVIAPFSKSSKQIAVFNRSDPNPDRSIRSLLIELFCAACLVFVVIYNMLGLLEKKRGSITPDAMNRISEVLMLRQKWAMFARPQHCNTWYVAQARLANGEQVDLLRNGQPVEHPKRASKQSSHRWVKYLQGLGRRKTSDRLRTLYAQHLFDTWNATHDATEQIKLLELLRFRQVLAVDEEDHFAKDIFGIIAAENTPIEKTLQWDAPWKMP